MVVSSTLVNVSDDAEVRLVALLAENAPENSLGPSFQADCQRSIDAGEAGPLLDTVLKNPGAIAALLALSDADEATASFSLLAALLERAERPVQDLTNAIVKANQVPNCEQRKISLLSVLYNMRADTNEKVSILTQMIALAGGTDGSAAKGSRTLLAPEETLGRMLCDPGEITPFPTGVPSKPRLVSTLDSWQVKDRKEIYRTVANVLPVSDQRKQRFLLLLVALYTDASSVDPQAIEAAKEAAIGAIRDPISLYVYQRNMMSLPAIQALGKSHGTLLGLLKVFQEGKLSDYESFMSSNGGEGAVLKSLGLDVETCKRNIRILSLCTLASELEEIPYSSIRETLKLQSDAEVEGWVIAAVSSGLLQAKMDQLQHKVMVERSVVRKFDIEQWKSLQSRLRVWKQNVGSLLAGLKESQVAAAAQKS